MLTDLRTHLSYANVMATIAVFVALGGSGYAAVKIDGKNLKNRSVAGNKLKKNTLGGKEINESKLAKVPKATLANTATTATRAGTADSAGNASNLDGRDSAAFLSSAPGAVGSANVADSSLTGADLAADEAPHVVGAAGEPTFGNGGGGDCLWQDFGAPFNPVSFYRGKDGRVHLAGVPAAQNGPGGCGGDVEDRRVFTLPPTYRPANVELFTSATDFGSVPLGVVIGADQDVQLDLGLGSSTIPAGAVIVLGSADLPQGMPLDGNDFRAAGTGGFE
jgi:hypothetical protein